MKKSLMIAASAVMLLSSCGTYTGTGAYTGSTLGSILGSAIGGITDGPRGSNVGTIIGMAGGAVIGAAVGSKADKKVNDRLERYEQGREERRTRANGQPVTEHPQYDDVVVDETNSGDDRLYDFNGTDYTGDYSANQPIEATPRDMGRMVATFPLEIQNARLVDENKDKMINGGELCKVIFEVVNVGGQTIYDVQPMVVEANRLKHISVSPPIHIEKLQPGKRIRYTALVHAGKRVKNSMARICLSIVAGNNGTVSKVTEFNIPTKR
ncbi:MAG: hypothetical protein MR536_09580 [Prevotella sp.]|nr:hypothetical protein [Prevotella sp.]MDY3852990.1 glycine zipper domain-containing protein [Prevotella sp.]